MMDGAARRDVLKLAAVGAAFPWSLAGGAVSGPGEAVAGAGLADLARVFAWVRAALVAALTGEAAFTGLSPIDSFCGQPASRF